MKHSTFNYSIYALVVAALLSTGCERDLDKLPLATNYNTNPELFIDGFSSGLDYAAWGKVTNFSLDYNDKLRGSTSMRFDVPNANDPFGISAGGQFFDKAGRDLSDYNVLTFWAKSTGADTLSVVGFGGSTNNGVIDESYKVSLNNLAITSVWTKYYIPIPDASRLSAEQVMFYYYVNPRKTGSGFTFWIDDLKYENLGTIAHATPGAIYSGKDMVLNSVENGTYKLPELSATYNLPTGVNQTISFSSGYLSLTSTNPVVASVDKKGSYKVAKAGSTLITAKLGSMPLKGSVLVNSIGQPILPSALAPAPVLPKSQVISLYSDSYTNVNVDSYQPFWSWSGGGLTADVKFYTLDGQNYFRYSNYNDIYNQKRVFVAISFESTPIDVTTMTHLHMNVFVPSTAPNVANKPTISLENWGANTGGTNSVGAYNHPSALPVNEWVTLDLPLSGFAGLTGKSQMVHIILDNFPTVVFLDNIYFHN